MIAMEEMEIIHKCKEKYDHLLTNYDCAFLSDDTGFRAACAVLLTILDIKKQEEKQHEKN